LGSVDRERDVYDIIFDAEEGSVVPQVTDCIPIGERRSRTSD
jgi:hypothetical protein